MELTPTLAVVDVHGVGYGLNISLATYEALRGRKDVKLYAVEVIREDAYLLWGFATKPERGLFTLLTGVSGIGAATARMVLSALSPAEVVDVISSGNERVLKGIKGIGPKAAQRIIVDLKDKVLQLGLDAGQGATGGTQPSQYAGNKEVHDDAIAALTAMGFSPAPSHKVVTQLLTDDPSMTIEQVIKKALKML